MKGLERRFSQTSGDPVTKPGESREVGIEKKV